jgi:putative endonuclease
MSKTDKSANASESHDQWFVYILECSDGSYYTGITNNLETRLRQHNEGDASRYTRSRRPVELRYHEPHASRSSALIRECAMKLKTHDEKRQLFDPDK